MLARRETLLLVLASLIPSGAAIAQTVVFEEDFEAGALPAEISPGVALLTGVQGFDGLGSAEDTFGGSFLRSPTGNVVTVQLDAMPPHEFVSIEFLFAAIDSLDGAGTTFPEGDYFKITLDGATIFFESFANALPSQVQTYTPPPGGELARHVHLGFSSGGYYSDSAYDFTIEPTLQEIPHTESSLTLTFEITGGGIQDLSDESWAFDHLRVLLNDPCPADLNGDGVVDGADLAALLAQWSGPGSADLTGDGNVDGADLAALLAAWGACP